MLKLHINHMGYFEIILLLISFVFVFCYSFHKKHGLSTNWPLVGMLPALLKNHSRIHDLFIELVEKSQLTFLVKGPWFTNMNLLVTVDPTNAHHILSKNFGNYPKGSKFKEIFEILGDDSEIWQYHRKMAHSVLGHPKFHQFLVEKVWEKIETGLIPILNRASEQRLEIDLQDLFERFAFDTISVVVMDYDPGCLCIDLPSLPFSKALHDAEEVIVYRHVVPTCVWKFQRWLGIGQEKKHKEAWKIIDDFIYGCISKKREEMHRNSQSKAYKVGNELGADLVTLYMDEVRNGAEIGSNGDKFLRDTILTFFAAGQDTTGAALSWFFYLLSKNPHVLFKIKEELDTIIWDRHNISSRSFDELSNKLIYLHVAIFEALRLYPPVPFNAKAPAEVDTLPSGHKVDPSMQIIFNMYAMGRMKSIWGEDCCEFKPGRWILETGKIRHEPSYKFLAFNSGPRTCTGKNMSLTIMKATIMTIISRYNIEPVQGHPIVPSQSVVLHMKHGFKTKVVSY
ncbi:hypothetical protein Cgig2_024370 [Carnegiea gigantea]|uniref:Cytochrome P450 n=1 Tax=Carnegiea gigantea TaxID=171969 RepID=A0A9Q1GWD0_9CARY|nr:hypothetical protein Cgig2_024370 [Carnegiea gigantea]